MAETNFSDSFPSTYHPWSLCDIVYVQSELQTTLFLTRLVNSYDAIIHFVTSWNFYSFGWLLVAISQKFEQTPTFLAMARSYSRALLL